MFSSHRSKVFFNSIVQLTNNAKIRYNIHQKRQTNISKNPFREQKKKIRESDTNKIIFEWEF
jgi:hypothetical protein